MRVGFFLRNLDEEYQINVFRGIRTQARARGVDVVCVQGETVRSDNDKQPFVFAEEVKFDGLLILSPVIIDHSDSSVALRLPRMLPAVPAISVGLKIPGMVSLTIQSVRSLKRVLEHLILDHGYRRFLYVGGPVAHRDNQVRERVFLKTMNESALWPALNWTVDHGGFFEASGVEVINRYLDGPPFDAVVAANDNMAIGLLRVLKMQDDPAWRNCAVTGFDDIPQATLEEPPLTSVHQPLDSLGAVSLDLLVDLIHGIPVPRARSISSRPVIRESCGCRSPGADLQPSGAWVDRRVLENHLAGIRRQAFETELRLREGGWFARDMSAVSTMEALTARLDELMRLLGVQDFFILASGRLQYERRRNVRAELPTEGLPMTAEQLFTGRPGLAPWALSVYHLRSGDENLGLAIYSVDDRSLPHLSAGLPHVAHALKRLKTLEEQAEHARYQLLQLILRTLPIPLAVFERSEGAILYTNRAFENAIGGPTTRPISAFLDLPEICEGVELSLKPGTRGPSVPVLVSTAGLAFEGSDASLVAMVDLSRQKALEAEVLRISEFERRRIGLDLHDDICQRLAGLTMYLKGFAKRPPADPSAALAEVGTMVDQTLHLTRQYAHASFPIDLEHHGLDSVLKNLCETVAIQNDCPCRYESALPSLPAPIIGAQALNLYRIVQEALQNAVKHSRASRLEVTLEVTDASVLLKIADNGRGLQREAERGLGFRSMAYRASQLGARFELSTRRGAGTVVLVQIPAASLQPELTESSSSGSSSS